VRPTLCADFNNADAAGRLRLNCVGTVEDLSRLGTDLRDGLAVTLRDEELEAEGIVQYSNADQSWVARIDWGTVHPRRAK
jgi:hypothetical protein